MRRRLMVAIMLLVAITLLVASVGSFLLIRRASANTAERELYTQAKFVADLAQRDIGLPRSVTNDLRAVRQVGDYRTLSIAALTADGTFTNGIPPAIADEDLRTGALNAGQSVAGSTGDVVYVLIPMSLTTSQKASLTRPIPYQDQPVLVATRTVQPPVSGLQWFIVIGVSSLAVAAVVAYLLANRFARPLEKAAAATQRIASGDLATRMPVSSADMPEFAALATAINAMGHTLARAQDQQRQFLLSVSHDLRTPLTSIRGYADAVVDGTTDDLAGAVRIIAVEAGRLERLVQDLLDLARLDAKRFSFRSAYVDVHEVVDRALLRFRPEAATASISLSRSSPAADPLWTVTDPDRLLQVLSNLLENAFRYAHSSIVLGARAESGQVIMWVDDDGPGIATDDLARVFEPHFTSDRAGSRGSGTGLGLAIVAELASAMGGGARAESPGGPGGGTRMVIWLPAAAGAPATKGAPTPTA